MLIQLRFFRVASLESGVNLNAQYRTLKREGYRYTPNCKKILASMPNYTLPDISDRDSDYSSEESDYAGDSEEDEKQTAARAST